MVSGISAARATWYGLPLSSASSCASSSPFFSIRSASLYIKLPRCEAVSFLRHGPWSKAERAAATALSTSAASASATWAMVSPVAGLMLGKVLPEAESVHLLLMSSLVALTFTVGSMAVEAVAMRIPPKDAARFPMGTSRRQEFALARSRQDGATPFGGRFVPADLQAVLPASRQRKEPTPAGGEKQGKRGRRQVRAVLEPSFTSGRTSRKARLMLKPRSAMVWSRWLGCRSQEELHLAGF